MTIDGLFSDVAQEKTIAAICTAPGPAGISIIRISGKECFTYADKMCGKRKTSDTKGGSFFYTLLHDPKDGSLIDEAIILVYRAPHSYTGEDCVEIQIHGGSISSKRVMEILVEEGASPAGAGEFTFRAFLNGRIDLSRAEGVLDIIEAQSDRAGKVAAEQLHGRLGKLIDKNYFSIMDICADVEASLDFMDDEMNGILEPVNVSERICSIVEDLSKLYSTWKEGKLLREGALLVLSGIPNAGKSTLFNALLGADRAIVTDIPGTTRDTIEEVLLINGIAVRLADTAGIRETEQIVEKIGIDRARDIATSADLRIAVIDMTNPIVEQLSELSHPDIVVLNKIDVAQEIDIDKAEKYLKDCNLKYCKISASTGEGIDLLKASIAEILRVDVVGNEMIAVSERHRKLIGEAIEFLTSAKEMYDKDREAGAVFCAQSLREAAEKLSQITGRNYSEDLLDGIFSRFCIGK